MANQLSKTDSSSNQDIRQRFNVKKTIIGVIVLLIGLCHLPEAILLIMGSSGMLLRNHDCFLLAREEKAGC